MTLPGACSVALGVLLSPLAPEVAHAADLYPACAEKVEHFAAPVPQQSDASPPAGDEPASDDEETPADGDAEDEKPPAMTWDFEKPAPGQLPEGWRIAQTNSTLAEASWSVVEMAGAPSGHRVLSLLRSENEGQVYNLALAEETRFGDVELSVEVKAVTGEEDQGGGPVWRCADESNYYVCRINPLENNYRVYVVKDGSRKELGSATVTLEEEKWYTLRVVMRGRKITCFLDDAELLNVVDETFTRPGMIGLWTKADAATAFDDLSIKELK